MDCRVYGPLKIIPHMSPLLTVTDVDGREGGRLAVSCGYVTAVLVAFICNTTFCDADR